MLYITFLSLISNSLYLPLPHSYIALPPKLAQFSLVQSLSRVLSLRPHELQHARPPCPSPTPRVHSNSHPSSRWCHPAISSSVVPFSSGPQPLPASESFPMSQLFAWGGQSTGVSASASFLPKNTQPLVTSLSVSFVIFISYIFLDFTCNSYHTVSVLLCLTYFS